MLKAVRRVRSHRTLVDAAVGQLQGPQVPAGDKVKAEGGKKGERREGEGENEGAHGPTTPYDPDPVIPDSVSGTALHDAGSSIPSSHGRGQGHVVGHGAHIQIVDIPPVRFPDGRNPYLDRPLPLPPPPKPITTNVATTAVAVPVTVVRPIMPPRPRTSSGQDSSRTSGLNTDFDRRLSRDDMALPTQMSMARTKKGLQPYRIGVKGGGALPTPEPSPNVMAPSPSPGPSFVPARVMTPESVSSGEIQIGMALGSPSHESLIAGWQPQPYPGIQEQVQSAYSPLPLPPAQQPQRTPSPPIQRQKTQKRRLFGLFGRKNVEAPKAVEVIEANNSAVSLTSNSSWQTDSTPARSNTVAGKKAAKQKPLLARSGTQPDISITGPLIQASAQNESRSQISGPGLLDVEIPDIRLERYSIMFSGVLNQQGSAPASSLLARRQATLEKLKTINDRIQDEEDEKLRNKNRRATSPQPTRSSPVFTLFPTTPARPPANSTLAPRPATSRMRSNTSPANLPSPARATFEETGHPHAARKEKKTVTIVSPRTMDERSRAAQVEKLREQQQQGQQRQAPPPAIMIQTITTPGFRFGPDESALILDSPQSISDDGREPYSPGDDSRPIPLKPTLAEPEWQMISTPPSSSSESGSSNSSKGTAISSSGSSSTLSSVQTQIARPPTSPESSTLPRNLPVDNDEDPDLKAAVEISIARQISISRQQRQLLLKPVQRSNTIASNGRQMVVNTGAAGFKMVSRSASSPNSVAAAAMASKAASKEQGRVVETKLAVPRLVSAAQNRKSESIVLEG